MEILKTDINDFTCNRLYCTDQLVVLITGR